MSPTGVAGGELRYARAADKTDKSMEVYRFFKSEGIRFIQFTPITERQPDSGTKDQGLWLAPPAKLDGEEPNTLVTPWTVEPKRYGEFLISIYEE